MLYDVRITPEQLKATAEWAAWTHDDGAEVELRRDDDVLTAEQGDDVVAFNVDGEPADEVRDDTLPTDILRTQQRIEHHAWRAVVSEMRLAGVGDVNAGGRHERLHDAIAAWGEELAQLRMMDPDPVHAEAALEQRRTKYLGSDS